MRPIDLSRRVRAELKRIVCAKSPAVRLGQPGRLFPIFDSWIDFLGSCLFAGNAEML